MQGAGLFIVKYGNTNTYYVDGLLFDTEMPGLMGGLYKALKENGIAFGDIRYVMASHYHPDHIGLISELMGRGVKLVVLEHQLPFVHFADGIFLRQYGQRYQPIDEAQAIFIKAEESRAF